MATSLVDGGLDPSNSNYKLLIYINILLLYYIYMPPYMPPIDNLYFVDI